MFRDALMGYLKASLVMQIVLAIYFEAVVWVPLGAWNNQPGKRLIEVVQSGEAPLAAVGFAGVMLLPVLMFALAYWRQWFWLMWVGLAGYGAWAVLQMQSWWIPYILGADARALRNQKFLERTTKILPSFSNHPAPEWDALCAGYTAIRCCCSHSRWPFETKTQGHRSGVNTSPRFVSALQVSATRLCRSEELRLRSIQNRLTTGCDIHYRRGPSHTCCRSTAGQNRRIAI